MSFNKIIVNTNSRVKENLDSKDSWNKLFLSLSEVEQCGLIKEFERIQSAYIRHSMGNMVNPIQVPVLGSFYYKATRKDFYDIRQELPNATIEEVIEEVKKRNIARETKRKRIKKEGITLNIQK